MLETLLNDVQTAAVLCNQFGDSGKGKVIHALAPWADVIARGTGGNNAGHTLILNGQEMVFHLIPSGIVYDHEGKINIMGNGMVIDLEELCKELDQLDTRKISYNNLMISQDAHVIMPYHISQDQQKNQSLAQGGIGSTGKGIGPCYTDKIARRGIMIGDLYDVDRLVKKIKKAELFYPEQKIDDGAIDDFIQKIKPLAARIKPFVRDTIQEMHQFYNQGKKILLEGAQGLLLSIEYGTYPYVTSSDCSLNGTAAGVGLSARAVDLPLGLVKFPFMTRVGGGPFPTELGGRDQEEYCQQPGRTLESELQLYEISSIREFNLESNQVRYDRRHPAILRMMNDSDPCIKAVGIRLAANEFGATTGRPRRIGWVDAVSARYATGINGPNFVLTKVDCVADTGHFNVCYGYNTNGTISPLFSRDSEALRGVSPEYKQYEGYSDLRDLTSYDKFPQSVRKAITEFEWFTKGKVVMLSTGPKDNQIIVKEA